MVFCCGGGRSGLSQAALGVRSRWGGRRTRGFNVALASDQLVIDATVKP